MKNPKKPRPADADAFIARATTATTGVDSTPTPTTTPQKQKKKGRPAENTVRATFDFPTSLHQAVKIQSAQQNIKMREWIMDAVYTKLNAKGLK